MPVRSTGNSTLVSAAESIENAVKALQDAATVESIENLTVQVDLLKKQSAFNTEMITGEDIEEVDEE